MASKRRVTVLSEYGSKVPAGVDPQAAIVQIDDLANSTGILGVDPKTGALGETPEKQFELAFQNMDALVTKSGLSLDEVGLVSVFIPGQQYREYINTAWLPTFPDENRPARKTNHVKLPEGVFIQLQVAAVAGGKRQRIDIPGVPHRDPIPNGTRIGNMIYSSVLVGQDPVTSRNVEGLIPQIQQTFDNTKTCMELGGASLNDIVHMWVFMQDFDHQPDMVDLWVKTWPKEGDRPARKTVRYATSIQMQATGVVGGKRTNYEIPGVGHHDPIPMGSKIGKVFMSSGISGTEPADPKAQGYAVGENQIRSGNTVEGLEPAIKQTQTNVQTLMEQAGGGLDNIVQITVLINDAATIPVVEKHVASLFPDASDRPALRFIDWNIDGGGTQAQYHVTGVF